MNFNFLGNSNSEVKEKKSFFQPKHPDFQSYINSYSNSAGPLLKNIPQRLTPLLDKYIYTDEEAKNQKTQPSSIQSELFSQKFCSQNKEQKGEHGKLNHIFELEVNDSEPHETGQFGFQDDTLSNTTETDYQSTFGYVKEESEVSSESSEDSEEVQNDPSFKTIDATILNTYKNKFPNHFELPKAREGNSPIENGPLFKKKEDSSSLSVVNPVLNTPKAYGTPSSLLSFQDFFKLCKSNSKNDDEIPPVSNQSSKSIDHSSSSNLVYRKQNTNTPNSTFKDYNQAMLSSSKPASVLQTPSSNSFNYNKNLISSAESTFNTPNIMTEEYEESSQSDPISEIIPKRINFDEYEGNLPVIHEENQRGITYEEDTDFESEIEGSDVEYIGKNFLLIILRFK